jgi:hypothetical protein
MEARVRVRVIVNNTHLDSLIGFAHLSDPAPRGHFYISQKVTYAHEL